MRYLLDTCVLAELRKPNPNRSVLQWIEAIEEHRLYLSVITLGEIQKGVAKLEESKRKQALQAWLEQDLVERFGQRLLDIDRDVVLEWGLLLGESARRGTPLPVIDGLIAATAICHNQTVVTRNISDFERFPVRILDPWAS